MQPRLNRDAIARVALALIEENGINAVTMRAVGARIGCEAMSLYRHVANKADLLRSVGELVIAEIRVPKRKAGGAATVRALLLELRRVALKYPAAFGLVSQSAVTAISATALEAGMQGFVDDGFTADEASHALCVCLTYAVGAIANELSALQLGMPLARAADPGACWEDTPLAGHFLQVMRRTNYRREFEFGLDAVLRGVRAAG